MTRRKFTLTSPEIVAILGDVWRSGLKTYYRIDADGKHVDCPVRQELIALGMSSKSATGLLQAAALPCAPFVGAKALAVQKTVDLSDEASCADDVADDIELDELEEPSLNQELGSAVSPSSKRGKKPLTVEEREERVAQQEEIANSRRYSYITTSTGKHGVWDEFNAYIVFLAWTKDEAIEEMARLKSGKSYAVSYAGGSGKTRPAVTY